MSRMCFLILGTFVLDESVIMETNMNVLRFVCTKLQCQHCDNSAMALVIQFPLKTMQSLKNGLQPILE